MDEQLQEVLDKLKVLPNHELIKVFYSVYHTGFIDGYNGNEKLFDFINEFKEEFKLWFENNGKITRMINNEF